MNKKIAHAGLIFNDNGGIWLPVASSDIENNTASNSVDYAIDIEAIEVVNNWLANFKTIYYKEDSNLNDGTAEWSRRGQEHTEERMANLLYRVYREGDLFNTFTFIARFVIWRYLLEADIEQGDMPPDVLPDSNMEQYLRVAEHARIGGIRFMPNGHNY